MCVYNTERKSDMKRYFSIFIAALLILAAAALPASADTPVRLYLTGPSSAEIGDSITVSLNLEGDYSANTLSVKVMFDNTTFRLSSIEQGDALRRMKSDGGYVICEELPEKNGVSLGVIMLITPTSETGLLVSLQFEVLSTASPSSEITVIVSEFEYAPLIGEGSHVDHTSENMTVTITNGTGAGTTSIPGPASPTSVPGTTPDPGAKATSSPGNTDPAEPTQDVPSNTDPADPASTDDPDNPGSRASDTNAPSVTKAPGTTDEPSSPGGLPKGAIRILVIIGCACGAALLAVIVLVVVRANKEKKNRKR